MATPYEMMGGEEKIRELATAFYDAMDSLPQAAEIRQMHGENLDVIKQKLFEYLSGWLGGPSLYSDKYGTVCLTSPHKPFAISADHRDQWLLCMDKALETIDAPQEIRDMLKGPMFQLADLVRNQP